MRIFHKLIPFMVLICLVPFSTQQDTPAANQIHALSFDGLAMDGGVVDRIWNISGSLIQPDGVPVPIDVNIPKRTTDDAIAMMVSRAANAQSGNDALTSVMKSDDQPNQVNLNGCTPILTATPIDNFKPDGTLVIAYHGNFGVQRVEYGPKLASELYFSVFGKHQMVHQNWELNGYLETIHGGSYLIHTGIPDGATMDAIVAGLKLIINNLDDHQYATISKVENGSDRLILKGCVLNLEVGPKERNKIAGELMMIKKHHLPR